MQEYYQLLKVASKYNDWVFAPLVVLTFGLMCIDVVTYDGFLTKTIGVPSTFFLVSSALSYALLIFDTFFNKAAFSKESILVLRINAVAYPLLMIIYYLFYQLEANHYPNYVFSTFHINLAQFDRVTIFSTFLFALFLFRKNLSFISRKIEAQQPSTELIGSVVFYVFALLFVSLQLLNRGTLVAKDLVDIARHPFYSYEERRREVFGTSYDLYTFISAHTEPDATIAVPPQNRWGILGNIGFSRYFLHPRYLLHPEDVQKDQWSQFDYYVVSSRFLDVDGNKYEIWPEYKLPIDSAITFEEISSKTQVLSLTEFDPSDEIYKGKWTLVRIRK